MRVLSVDDDAVSRLAIEEALEDHATVTSASDGLEAIKVLEGEIEPFDVVLLDLNLPGANGFEVLERLRAIERHARTPVMILTTATNEQLRHRAKGLGVASWIVKPINPTGLILALRVALDRRH